MSLLVTISCDDIITSWPVSSIRVQITCTHDQYCYFVSHADAYTIQLCDALVALSLFGPLISLPVAIGFWRLKYHTIILHHDTCNISIKWPSSYFYHIWPTNGSTRKCITPESIIGFMSPLLVGNGCIVRWDDDLGINIWHVIWKQWTQMIKVTNNRWHSRHTTVSLYIPQSNQLTQWARHNH